MIKPPLGTAPHWFVYNRRMQELSNAIQRHLEHIEKYNCIENAEQYYKAISSWAKEIVVLASLEAEFEKNHEG